MCRRSQAPAQICYLPWSNEGCVTPRKQKFDLCIKCYEIIILFSKGDTKLE